MPKKNLVKWTCESLLTFLFSVPYDGEYVSGMCLATKQFEWSSLIEIHCSLAVVSHVSILNIALILTNNQHLKSYMTHVCDPIHSIQNRAKNESFSTHILLAQTSIRLWNQPWSEWQRWSEKNNRDRDGAKKKKCDVLNNNHNNNNDTENELLWHRHSFEQDKSCWRNTRI